jgi:hypothetical protein
LKFLARKNLQVSNLRITFRQSFQKKEDSLVKLVKEHILAAIAAP